MPISPGYTKSPKSVVDLRMNHSGLKDEDLSLLKRFSNLKHLGLSSNEITDAGLVNLKEAIHLEGLELSNTKVTGSCFNELGTLENLTYLSLDSTPFKNNNAKLLSAFTNRNLSITLRHFFC